MSRSRRASGWLGPRPAAAASARRSHAGVGVTLRAVAGRRRNSLAAWHWTLTVTGSRCLKSCAKWPQRAWRAQAQCRSLRASAGPQAGRAGPPATGESLSPTQPPAGSSRRPPSAAAVGPGNIIESLLPRISLSRCQCTVNIMIIVISRRVMACRVRAESESLGPGPGH